MEQANLGQANLRQDMAWLPVLIFGYFESLRRTTFLAFGWIEHGMTFVIITLMVIFLAVMEIDAVHRVRLWMARIGILGYITFIGYFSYLYDPAHKSVLLGMLFGVPDFGQGSLTPSEAAAFSFFLIFGYGVLVFLISNFILEKRSYLEIFAASALLLGVEIAVADYKLTVPVVAHIFFLLLLRNQLRLLEVFSYGERVVSKTGRVVGGGWYFTGAAVALVGIGIALLLPAHQADMRGVLDRLKPSAQFQSAESPGTSGLPGVPGTPETPGAAGTPEAQNTAAAPESSDTPGTAADGSSRRDSFYYFWGRLNDFEIGGSLKLENKPALWVKADEPFYWRGDTADYYTGKGWRNTVEIEGEDVSGRGLSNPYSKFAEVRRVEQNFVLAPGMTSKVVFAANTPALLEVPSGRFKWDRADNVFTDYMASGSSYKVVSYIPKFDVGKLRNQDTSYPIDVRNKYLQLPKNLPDRVKNKTRAIIARADNPYDKAKAVERYLADNFPYDLTVEATPKGRDVVDYFLFDLKKGYCTYHSTAMVVMLRSVGIPTRWVKGYMTGSRDDTTGVYEVSQADAHAWVEVYFADFGWIAFEPTASFRLPETQASSAETEKLVEEAEPAGALPDIAELPPEEAVSTARSLLVLAFFAILIGVGVLWFLFIRKKRFKAGKNHTQIRDFYIDLLALLQYKGYPRRDTETPYEYARTLAGKLPGDHQDITAITELYIQYQYGKSAVTEAETEQAKAIWERLSDKLLKKRKD